LVDLLREHNFSVSSAFYTLPQTQNITPAFATRRQ